MKLTKEKIIYNSIEILKQIQNICKKIKRWDSIKIWQQEIRLFIFKMLSRCYMIYVHTYLEFTLSRPVSFSTSAFPLDKIKSNNSLQII